MPDAGVWIHGLVSRLLPQKRPDNTESGPARFSPYGEQYMVPAVRKQHVLADEGSYFVCNNASVTGILSSAATGFVATTPSLIVYNNGAIGGKRIYLDYLRLVTTVVGSAASALARVEGAIWIDNTNRYASGGTELTANTRCPNMDADNTSIAKVYFGAITAGAATASARCVEPLITFRSTVSATVADVVGETKLINFGGVEAMLNGSITVANNNNIPVSVPPVIIGPQQSALIYTWQAVGGTNVAATYAPNLAWWER